MTGRKAAILSQSLPAGGALAQAGAENKAVGKSKEAKSFRPVVFACDENYAPYLPAVMQSLLEHISATDCYEIIIMDCCAQAQAAAFAESLRDTAEMLAPYHNLSLRVIAVREALENYAFLRQNEQALKRYGYGTYARILIPDLLGAYEKALYLDIDHIILADPAELFALLPGDKLIAAVPDINVAALRLRRDSPRKRLVERRLGLRPEHYYTIASPLLFNIQACRKFGFTARIFALLAQNSGLPFPDQDAINAVCKGQIGYLPQKWGRVNARNFAGLCAFIRQKGTAEQVAVLLGDWRADSADIALIHYVSTPKPWNGIGPDYSGLWWRYATRTKNGAALLFALLFPLAKAETGHYWLKRYKLFGLPLLTVKTFPEKIYYQWGKWIFARKIYGKENCYIYIFGLKCLTIHKKQRRAGQL